MCLGQQLVFMTGLQYTKSSARYQIASLFRDEHFDASLCLDRGQFLYYFWYKLLKRIALEFVGIFTIRFIQTEFYNIGGVCCYMVNNFNAKVWNLFPFCAGTQRHLLMHKRSDSEIRRISVCVLLLWVYLWHVPTLSPEEGLCTQQQQLKKNCVTNHIKARAC